MESERKMHKTMVQSQYKTVLKQLVTNTKLLCMKSFQDWKLQLAE